MSAGTIFIELDLDSTKYKSKMAEIQATANKSSLALESNFMRLGGKSDQMYQAMRQSATNAYNMITNSAKSSTAERLRAHRLYAAEIKRIDDEQTGRMTKNLGAIKVGWLTMVKGAIVFRVAMSAIHGLYEATIGSFRRGIESINQMNLATASLAAAFATNDPSLPFERAYKIAGGVVERIQEMDRAFVGTATELQTLVDAWATYGGAVDFSTEKARDEFVVFANIIKLMTRGQAFERQAMQETRALMEGKNIQGALLLKKLIAMEPKVQSLIPLWREQGTLITNINRLMSGYVEGSEKIEDTLEAQQSSLSTITYKILRDAMAPAYEDIKGLIRAINDYLLDTNGLTEEAKTLVAGLRAGWVGVKTAVLSVASAAVLVVGAFKTVGIAIGGIASVIKDVLSAKFIDYSIWDEVREQIDSTTAALKRLSEAADPSVGAAPDADVLLKTKGARGKGAGGGKKSKSADLLAKSWMNALEAMSDSYDDYVESVESAALEYTNYMIELDKKMFADRAKLIQNDLGNWLEWQQAETDALVEEALRQQKVWEEAQKKKQEYAEQLRDWVIHGFENMSDVVAEFVTTGKASFKDFVNSAVADLARLVTKMSIFKILGGLGFGDYLKIGARAAGGPVAAATPYIVGERGPELFVPSSAGTIVPNAGPKNVTVNIRNESGQKMEAKQARASFDTQGYIIDVVLDGINRNVHGMRDALGGG